MQLLEESLLELQVNPLYFILACWHKSVSHIVNFDAPLNCTTDSLKTAFSIVEFIIDINVDRFPKNSLALTFALTVIAFI